MGVKSDERWSRLSPARQDDGENGLNFAGWTIKARAGDQAGMKPFASEALAEFV